MVWFNSIFSDCDLPVNLFSPPQKTVGWLAQIHQATPEEAVLSYYEAVNHGDLELMKELLDPGDESNSRFLHAFGDTLNSGIRFRLEDVRLYIVENSDKWTRIRTNHHQYMYQKERLMAETDAGGEYTLIRKNNRWYFIGMGDPIRPGWKVE